MTESLEPGEEAARLAELLARMEELLDLVEDRFGYLTFRITPELVAVAADHLTYRMTLEPYAATYAAGGLARCVALARAMCVLAVERPDTLGTLTRPFYEAWIVAMYLKYCGSAAFERLERAHKHEVRTISNARKASPKPARNGDPNPILASKGGASGRLSVADLPALIDPHLVAEAVAEGEEYPITNMSQIGYDRLYREESLLETHAGIGSFGRYVVFRDHRPYGEVTGRPGPAHAPTRVLFIAALLLGRLARKIFRDVGLREGPLVDAMDRVAAVLPVLAEQIALLEERRRRPDRLVHGRLVDLLNQRVEMLGGTQVAIRALRRSSRFRRAGRKASA